MTEALASLRDYGSRVARGFRNPEENDDVPKSLMPREGPRG